MGAAVTGSLWGCPSAGWSSRDLQVLGAQSHDFGCVPLRPLLLPPVRDRNSGSWPWRRSRGEPEKASELKPAPAPATRMQQTAEGEKKKKKNSTKIINMCTNSLVIQKISHLSLHFICSAFTFSPHKTNTWLKLKMFRVSYN